MPPRSSATFNYSVNIGKHRLRRQPGWVATGKITVANPNDWEAVRINVTPAIDNGGVCTVTNGTGALVSAGGSVTLDYSCAYASAPNPASGLNTGHRNLDGCDILNAPRLRNGYVRLVLRHPDDRDQQDRHRDGHLQRLDEHPGNGRVSPARPRLWAHTR